MTKKQILEKCIQAYQLAIVDAKDMSYQDLQLYLEIKNMELGICVFVRMMLWQANLDWVKKYIPSSGYYWCEPPTFCSSKSEILESLNHRLNILKQEYDNRTT